jgi:hypothetical protein
MVPFKLDINSLLYFKKYIGKYRLYILLAIANNLIANAYNF